MTATKKMRNGLSVTLLLACFKVYLIPHVKVIGRMRTNCRQAQQGRPRLSFKFPALIIRMSPTKKRRGFGVALFMRVFRKVCLIPHRKCERADVRHLQTCAKGVTRLAFIIPALIKRMLAKTRNVTALPSRFFMRAFHKSLLNTPPTGDRTDVATLGKCAQQWQTRLNCKFSTLILRMTATKKSVLALAPRFY